MSFRKTEKRCCGFKDDFYYFWIFRKGCFASKGRKSTIQFSQGGWIYSVSLLTNTPLPRLVIIIKFSQSCTAIGPFHYTPKNFENGGFSLKTHQLFSLHTWPEKLFEHATITAYFGFVFEKSLVREIAWLWWRHRFRRRSVVEMFSGLTKTQSRRFQIPPVWRAFSKSARFPDGLVRRKA